LITLAGGRILEVNPPKIQHNKEEWEPYFDIMASDNYEQIIHTIIDGRKLDSVSLVFLQQKMFEPEVVIKRAIDNLVKQKKIRPLKFKGFDHYISNTSFDRLVDTIEKYLSDFHGKNAHLPGLNHQELFDGTGYSWIQTDIFDAAIKKLLNSKTIKIDQNYYSLNDFSIKVSRDIDIVQNEIVQLIKESRFSPLTSDEISKKIDLPLTEVRSIFNILVKSHNLVSINRDIFIEESVWRELLVFLRNFFEDQTEMPVASLKEFINTTRKYAIPIFEYLDSQGITVRDGDIRKKGHNL
jgi:selenocysteine-specific elongation factor